MKQIKYFLKNWIVRIVSFFFHREKLLHTQLSLVCCLSFNQMWFSVYLVLIFHNNYVHVGFVNICICTAFYLFHSFYKTTILFFCLEILASAKVKFIWQSKSFNIQLTLSFIIGLWMKRTLENSFSFLMDKILLVYIYRCIFRSLLVLIIQVTSGIKHSNIRRILGEKKSFPSLFLTKPFLV